MAGDDPVDDLGFARGLDLDRQVVLDHTDLLDQFCTTDDQVVYGIVDGVDLRPHGCEVLVQAHDRFRKSADSEARTHDLASNLVIMRAQRQSKESLTPTSGPRGHGGPLIGIQRR